MPPDRRPPARSRTARPVPVVILAAGRGRRFGGGKLTARFRGCPLIRHAVDLYCRHPAFGPVIVVTRHRGGAITRALAGLPCRRVTAPAPARGMAASLAAGARAAPPGRALAVQPGDMPLIDAASLDRLLHHWRPHRILRPVHEGTPGHPVIWPAFLGPALRRLTGEYGARRLLARHPALLDRISTGPETILDVDLPAHLNALVTR